ncbi:MAG: hypothetical protein K2W33_17520, partial [Burkholderiales bacterium]|nr:hypothetical protein [Burkholderiales bacterium]
IVHLPVKIIGQGNWAPDKGSPVERFLTTESIAENSIILSGTVGFMQEKTGVRLANAAARQP